MMSDDKIRLASMQELHPILLNVLKEGSLVKLVVTGKSMYPLLRGQTDSIVLRKNMKILKYDILLYKRDNGEYVLHRVVKIKKNGLCMAGDFETVVEYPVHENQVIAVVDSFYRNNRHISCRNPFYRIYCFLWVLFFPYRLKIIGIVTKLRTAAKSRRWK